MSADQDDAPDDGSTAGDGRRGRARPAKQPVTIDLQADAVEPPPPDAPSAAGAAPAGPETTAAAPSPPPPEARRTGYAGLIAAAIAGGIVATLLGIAYHASGIVPGRAETAAAEAAAKAETAAAAVTGLASRVAAVESRPPAATADAVTALDQKVAAVERTVAGLDAGAGDVTARLGDVAARVKDLAARVAALEARPAVSVSPGTGDTGGLSAALADMESRLGRVAADAATVAGLGERIAAVEETVKSLGAQVDALAARPAASPDGERAARALAVAMLRQAAEGSAPFAGDLATLDALGVDGATIAALRPLAEKGVPGVAALQTGFPAVADAILAASEAPAAGAGVFDRVAAFGRGLVSIRPTTAIPGDTPEAIVSRMRAAVERGDLAAALAERAALPDPGQAASEPWASAASDRVALDGLVAGLAGAPAAK